MKRLLTLLKEDNMFYCWVAWQMHAGGAGYHFVNYWTQDFCDLISRNVSKNLWERVNNEL